MAPPPSVTRKRSRCGRRRKTSGADQGLRPAAGPDVEFQRWAGGRPQVVQRGVRYTGGWIVDGRPERLPEVFPIPWPEVAEVDPAASVFVVGAPGPPVSGLGRNYSPVRVDMEAP